MRSAIVSKIDKNGGSTVNLRSATNGKAVSRGSLFEVDGEILRPKPRLLFFRWHREGLPSFITTHLREQVQCLEHFFNVIVVDYDCDYGEICDKFQPDVSLFESGVYAGNRHIRNTGSHPDIPKLGFLHADAFDASRAAFLSDMERWGVVDFCTTSVSMAEYTPEIADRLFVWPNSIDPNVFRDYGLDKNIPVLFTGSQARHYPWRNAVSRAVSQFYPTMNTPHFGWNGESGSARILHGETYARMLNASIFVPTCGTMARDVVRKHLEVPASMACLLTECTASIESFGFRDMVNCVFVDETNVVDKIDHLLANPEILHGIVQAGFDLVHTKHAQGNRDQILQWFTLQRRLRPGCRIVQENPSGDLSVAPSSDVSRHHEVISLGRDRIQLGQGWEKIGSGRPREATTHFLRCLNYFFIPEAVVGMVFCNLLDGDPVSAKAWIDRALFASLSHHGAADPDPVQWACYLRSLLCCGDLSAAVLSAEKYPSLRHPELKRMQQAIGVIAGVDEIDRSTETYGGSDRASITPIPYRSQTDWNAELSLMLRACGQSNLDRLLQLGQQSRTMAGKARQKTRKKPLARVMSGQWSRPRVKKILSDLYESKFVKQGRSWLAPLKQRILEDDWSRFLKDLISREPLTRAVIVASTNWTRGERSVRMGLLENPELPDVVTVRVGRKETLSPTLLTVEETLVEGREDSRLLVFLSRFGIAAVRNLASISSAALVVIEGINTQPGQKIVADLMEKGTFFLVIHQPEKGPGYAVLRRSANQFAVQRLESSDE